MIEVGCVGRLEISEISELPDVRRRDRTVIEVDGIQVRRSEEEGVW
jgi:hypothetical protein